MILKNIFFSQNQELQWNWWSPGLVCWWALEKLWIIWFYFCYTEIKSALCEDPNQIFEACFLSNTSPVSSRGRQLPLNGWAEPLNPTGCSGGLCRGVMSWQKEKKRWCLSNFLHFSYYYSNKAKSKKLHNSWSIFSVQLALSYLKPRVSDK